MSLGDPLRCISISPPLAYEHMLNIPGKGSCSSGVSNNLTVLQPRIIP